MQRNSPFHIVRNVIFEGGAILRYAKRLEVVRSTKEERITKIKEGVESGRDLEDIDIYSDAGSTMSVMSRRTTKTGMSRASTTATCFVGLAVQSGGDKTV
ncbi:unnamed protein product [Strongylus vulgaris]|uniref:ELP1 three-helical bundle domain-containing protein n=1 Tax=Strongylus vulgaris TaxID=40348 RepID=A0A3P7ISN1_STRVU|nr:unnamed protein product [Strongylus vulgaris]